MSAPKLVIGANGFLGSHVTRQLVAAGHDVRVMVRDGANTIGIDDLTAERFIGDIWDNDTLRAAMTGPKRAVDLFGALFYRDIRDDQIPLLSLATGEAIACLNYLIGLGELRCHTDDQGVLWYEPVA